MEMLHLVAASCLSLADFGSTPQPDHPAVALKVRDLHHATMRKAYRDFEASGKAWEEESVAKDVLKDTAGQLTVGVIQAWKGFQDFLNQPRFVVRSAETENGDGYAFIAISPNDEGNFDSVMEFAEYNIRDILVNNQSDLPLGWTKAEQQLHLFHAMAVMDHPAVRTGEMRETIVRYIRRGLCEEEMAALRAKTDALAFDVTSFAPGAEKRLNVRFFPPSFQASSGAYIHGGLIKQLPGTGLLVAFENGAHQMLLPQGGPGNPHLILATALRTALWKELTTHGIHPMAHPTPSVTSMRLVKKWPLRSSLLELKERISCKESLEGYYSFPGEQGHRFNTAELKGNTWPESVFSYHPPSFMGGKAVFVWRPEADVFFFAFPDGQFDGLATTAYGPKNAFVQMGLRVLGFWLRAHAAVPPASAAVDAFVDEKMLPRGTDAIQAAVAGIKKASKEARGVPWVSSPAMTAKSAALAKAVRFATYVGDKLVVRDSEGEVVAAAKSEAMRQELVEAIARAIKNPTPTNSMEALRQIDRCKSLVKPSGILFGSGTWYVDALKAAAALVTDEETKANEAAAAAAIAKASEAVVVAVAAATKTRPAVRRPTASAAVPPTGSNNEEDRQSMVDAMADVIRKPCRDTAQKVLLHIDLCRKVAVDHPLGSDLWYANLLGDMLSRDADEVFRDCQALVDGLNEATAVVAAERDAEEESDGSEDDDCPCQGLSVDTSFSDLGDEEEDRETTTAAVLATLAANRLRHPIREGKCGKHHDQSCQMLQVKRQAAVSAYMLGDSSDLNKRGMAMMELGMNLVSQTSPLGSPAWTATMSAAASADPEAMQRATALLLSFHRQPLSSDDKEAAARAGRAAVAFHSAALTAATNPKETATTAKEKTLGKDDNHLAGVIAARVVYLAEEMVKVRAQTDAAAAAAPDPVAAAKMVSAARVESYNITTDHLSGDEAAELIKLADGVLDLVVATKEVAAAAVVASKAWRAVKTVDGVEMKDAVAAAVRLAAAENDLREKREQVLEVVAKSSDPALYRLIMTRCEDMARDREGVVSHAKTENVPTRPRAEAAAAVLTMGLTDEEAAALAAEIDAAEVHRTVDKTVRSFTKQIFDRFDGV
jgi:hypothetical protein